MYRPDDLERLVVFRDGRSDESLFICRTLSLRVTWNASPRDAKGQRSAYEEALIGTPVAKDDEPLEIIRTIHSFDPCLACAVHVYDPDGKMVHQVQVQ